LVDVFEAAVEAAVDDAAAVPVDDFVAAFFAELLFALAFEAPAAFFLGDAAFFFGLLALALPAAFGLAAAFAFGLAFVAVLAFLALAGAFFLLALTAGVGVADGAVVFVTALVFQVHW